MKPPLSNITAAILAGGLGTRLRPVVADRPKVLALVRARPYLAYLLDQLVSAGVTQTVLLTGYGAEQVRATFGDLYGGMRLAYSAEPQPLGTAGALGYALPRMESDSVLVLNGDSYCDVALAEFTAFHQNHDGEASLVLTQV